MGGCLEFGLHYVFYSHRRSTNGFLDPKERFDISMLIFFWTHAIFEKSLSIEMYILQHLRQGFWFQGDGHIVYNSKKSFVLFSCFV